MSHRKTHKAERGRQSLETFVSSSKPKSFSVASTRDTLSKQLTTERQDVKNTNGDRREHEYDPQAKPKFFTQKAEELAYTHLQGNKEQAKTEQNIGTGAEQLRAQGLKFVEEHLSATANETNEHLPRETKSFKGEEKAEPRRYLCGLDVVPTLKARGWPKVAQEWLKRERKWPSPDMVHRVIQDGFQRRGLLKRVSTWW